MIMVTGIRLNPMSANIPMSASATVSARIAQLNITLIWICRAKNSAGKKLSFTLADQKKATASVRQSFSADRCDRFFFVSARRPSILSSVTGAEAEKRSSGEKE